MSYTISKAFEFAASHVLEGLPEGHKCGRMHGHNYVVEVELEAEDLTRVGFVLDYADLDKWADDVRTLFDHRHINDVVTFNPSAERLAFYLYAMAAELYGDELVTAVRVRESPRTCAEFRP